MDELYRERLRDYTEELEDAKKSYLEAGKQLEEAIDWKYKMMGNLVEAYERLEKLKQEKQ